MPSHTDRFGGLPGSLNDQLLGVLLQALYLSNDMDFLLAAPIPIRAVFLTKLLQAVLPNFILVMLIGLPVCSVLEWKAGTMPCIIRWW